MVYSGLDSGSNGPGSSPGRLPVLRCALGQDTLLL